MLEASQANNYQQHHYLNCFVIDRPRNDNAPPLYSRIIEYLKGGYAVIYAMEVLPCMAVQKMAAMDEQVEDFIESGALQVVDPESIYAKIGRCDPIDVWHPMIRKAGRQFRPRSIIAISTPELFARGGRISDVVHFERELGMKSRERIEVVCCYNFENFASLSLAEAVSLLAMRDGGSRHYQECKPKIISRMKRGLDKSLGSGSGRLVMATMKAVYRMDADALLADPELFEEKLRRFVGKWADRAVAEMVNEIKEEMVLSQKSRI